MSQKRRRKFTTNLKVYAVGWNYKIEFWTLERSGCGAAANNAMIDEPRGGNKTDLQRIC